MESAKIVLILGTVGSGKSFLLGRLLRRNTLRPQYIVSRFPDPSITKHVKVQLIRIERYPKEHGLWKIKKKRYLLTVEPLLREELKKFQGDLARTAARTGGVLAIDEGHVILRRNEVHPELVKVIRGARHYGLYVYIATQRLTDITTEIRAVITHMFIFRTTSGRDLEILSDELGTDVTAFDVDKLPRGAFLFVDRTTGELEVIR